MSEWHQKVSDTLIKLIDATQEHSRNFQQLHEKQIEIIRKVNILLTKEQERSKTPEPTTTDLEVDGVSEWQPIETAPKDGRAVLVLDTGAILISQWVDDEDGIGWWDNGLMEPPPTHWMPLPDPPKPPTTEAP